MERRIVPTFEEYTAHLDETLKNDPLMVLVKKSPRSYLYSENNMGMLSESEIDNVEKILRENGFEQLEKDIIWESGVPKMVKRGGEYVMETKEYPHRLRRCFMKPNSTMYVQLFIPTNLYTQEIFFSEPETHHWNMGTEGQRKIGEFNVRGEYSFHPHGTFGNCIAEQLPNYQKWLEQYRNMRLTDKERDAVFGTAVDPVIPDRQIGRRIFTQEMADLLRQFSAIPGSSIFYMCNRPWIIARNNLALSYE